MKTPIPKVLAALTVPLLFAAASKPLLTANKKIIFINC
ncbi:hypothetical protein ABIC45_002923 [Mucilaginibacter rubeus]